MSGAVAPRLWLASFRAERILYDGEGLLVVDKPTGMPTYGGDAALAHGLTARLSSFLEQQGRPARLGVHQRLDQDTSGVLLFTTDPARDSEVARAIEKHELSRIYRAVVTDPRGVLEDGRVELSLEDDGKRSRIVSSGGKLAVTHVRVLSRHGERADVELSLETGRLHQIRVTLAHLGAPVLGDRLYGGQPAWRLFLHAWRLGGGPLPRPLEAGLPPEFSRAARGEALTRPVTVAEARSLLLDAACQRAPLLAQTNAFRLLHGEADGLAGVEIDVFGKWAWLHGDERALPEGTERVLIEELLGLGMEGVGAAPRRVGRGEAGRAAARPSAARWHGVALTEPALVDEAGLLFEVPLSEVEAFPLEQRELRRRAAEWARGGSGQAGAVLCTSAHVGTVGLAALALGSELTVVDRSAAGLERLRALQPGSQGARFLKEEALPFLARAARRDERFALVVVDLTAARSERERQELSCLALSRVMPQGKLLVARSPDVLGHRQLRRLVHAAAGALGRTLRFAKEVPRPLDFEATADDALPRKALLAELA